MDQTEQTSESSRFEGNIQIDENGRLPPYMSSDGHLRRGEQTKDMSKEEIQKLMDLYV